MQHALHAHAFAGLALALTWAPPCCQRTLRCPLHPASLLLHHRRALLLSCPWWGCCCWRRLCWWPEAGPLRWSLQQQKGGARRLRNEKTGATWWRCWMKETNAGEAFDFLWRSRTRADEIARDEARSKTTKQLPFFLRSCITPASLYTDTGCCSAMRSCVRRPGRISCCRPLPGCSVLRTPLAAAASRAP